MATILSTDEVKELTRELGLLLDAYAEVSLRRELREARDEAISRHAAALRA